jgi:hypothetical protein
MTKHSSLEKEQKRRSKRLQPSNQNETVSGEGNVSTSSSAQTARSQNNNTAVIAVQATNIATHPSVAQHDQIVEDKAQMQSSQSSPNAQGDEQSHHLRSADKNKSKDIVENDAHVGQNVNMSINNVEETKGAIEAHTTETCLRY